MGFMIEFMFVWKIMRCVFELEHECVHPVYVFVCDHIGMV